MELIFFQKIFINVNNIFIKLFLIQLNLIIFKHKGPEYTMINDVIWFDPSKVKKWLMEGIKEYHKEVEYKLAERQKEMNTKHKVVI